MTRAVLFPIIDTLLTNSFFQYEMLTELKERRKQNSWGKMAEMPKKVKNIYFYYICFTNKLNHDSQYKIYLGEGRQGGG